MRLTITPQRELFKRDPMLYGHFLEHFHRQIYGGIFDPGSPLSDEDGFRTDVMEALKKIRTPIIRWPGGCFVSSYNWKKGVGKRVPVFDKSWRVEDPNTFGTDEFVKFCRKLGCEPYICTNAGTGTAEEMSDWIEYCNLATEGEYARMRIENGYPEPHNVRFWSVGNENWGGHELGAKEISEWGRLVRESCKLMQRVDPDASLSAAALVDLDWNVSLLRKCSRWLDWISIHAYWDWIQTDNNLAPYAKCMAYTAELEDDINKVRGLLTAMGLEKKIRIAFDEWNLRGWYHPNIHTVYMGRTPDEYLTPRDDNDINSSYTMADAVFSACFLNTLLRNADIVGMANFSPVVNTRGAIFTHPDGIVLRTTYHVFDMYVSLMGDTVIDSWMQEEESYTVPGRKDEDVTVGLTDCVATVDSATGAIAVSCINKHETDAKEITLELPVSGKVTVTSLIGESADDYNDIGRDSVHPVDNPGAVLEKGENFIRLCLPAHSVNVVRIG
ncbi:MAG: alpha-N-arabinofuranosidase [Oscillospiraceae bacterium]|nr:alpha-N-arabinofuranosidase [Oscillospiraceae bacterium]